MKNKTKKPQFYERVTCPECICKKCMGEGYIYEEMGLDLEKYMKNKKEEKPKTRDKFLRTGYKSNRWIWTWRWI